MSNKTNFNEIILPKMGINLLKELAEKLEKEYQVLTDEVKLLLNNPTLEMEKLEKEIDILNKEIFKLENLANKNEFKVEIKNLKRERFLKQDEYKKIDSLFYRNLNKVSSKKNEEAWNYRQDLYKTSVALKEIVNFFETIAK